MLWCPARANTQLTHVFAFFLLVDFWSRQKSQTLICSLAVIITEAIFFYKHWGGEKLETKRQTQSRGFFSRKQAAVETTRLAQHSSAGGRRTKREETMMQSENKLPVGAVRDSTVFPFETWTLHSGCSPGGQPQSQLTTRLTYTRFSLTANRAHKSIRRSPSL